MQIDGGIPALNCYYAHSEDGSLQACLPSLHSLPDVNAVTWCAVLPSLLDSISSACTSKLVVSARYDATHVSPAVTLPLATSNLALITRTTLRPFCTHVQRRCYWKLADTPNIVLMHYRSPSANPRAEEQMGDEAAPNGHHDPSAAYADHHSAPAAYAAAAPAPADPHVHAADAHYAAYEPKHEPGVGLPVAGGGPGGHAAVQMPALEHYQSVAGLPGPESLPPGQWDRPAEPGTWLPGNMVRGKASLLSALPRGGACFYNFCCH